MPAIPTPARRGYRALAAALAVALLHPDAALAQCQSTASDSLGPYYQPGAPFDPQIAGPQEAGQRVVITGRVLGMPDCRPLAGAIVDVWQASANGDYYDLRPNAEADANRHRLRGRVRTDEQGRYRIETVLPGEYGLGYGRSRPRHIHFVVSHPGQQRLVTQLYFSGEGLPAPRFADRSQVTELQRSDTGYGGTFDIVLPPG
jgi:catechol 1,2-dioxygenase